MVCLNPIGVGTLLLEQPCDFLKPAGDVDIQDLGHRQPSHLPAVGPGCAYQKTGLPTPVPTPADDLFGSERHHELQAAAAQWSCRGEESGHISGSGPG